MTPYSLEHLAPFFPIYFGNSQYAQIKLAASLNTNILIIGKSGSPFELAAQSIHFLGKRNEKPFLTADHFLTTLQECETALFGKHYYNSEGTKQINKGLIQAANRGTLYFGEVTFLPSHIQYELMNSMDRGSIIPIGSTEPIGIDVRLISSTDKNPDSSVQSGILRRDFYYWISTITISLVSINDRREDIAPLANHLLKYFNTKHIRNIQGFTVEAMQFLKNFEWVGEFRQFENVIERAVILCKETSISTKHLPEYITNTNNRSIYLLTTKSLKEATADFQKQYILNTLKESSFIKEKVAKQLGIGISSLYRKLEELNISDNELKFPETNTT
jgi:DNA-binding NtrC family response regulator